MTKDELIERLADIEHARWSDWQKYLHSLGVRIEEDDLGVLRAGEVIIPAATVAHWDRLIVTDYADLPEHSKQADRDQVARYWPVIVEFVAEWLDGLTFANDIESPYLAKQWREEMQPQRKEG